GQELRRRAAAQVRHRDRRLDRLDDRAGDLPGRRGADRQAARLLRQPARQRRLHAAAVLHAAGQPLAVRHCAAARQGDDSGVPEVFDLTAIAADTRLTLEQRRLRIVSAVMASSAEPIAFPPEPIDGNLYVDGGLRLHVFFTQELMAALDDHPVDVSVVVSGDMAVPRECTGLGLLSIVGRTASIAIDQLLRASVQGLLAVGTKPGNKARMINAAPLIYYGNELPAGTPRPP